MLTVHFYHCPVSLQVSCLEAPSTVQSGASQCIWSSEELSCTLRKPPTDPFFIILVAMLTMIMTIPILFLIQFVLDNYACKTPRMAIADANKSTKTDTNENLQMQEQVLGNQAAHISDIASEIEQCQSDFARIIRRSSGSDDSSGVSSSIEVAHFAYAGKIIILYYSCEYIVKKLFVINMRIYYFHSLRINLTDLLTPGEEAATLLERVRHFLSFDDTDRYSLPWEMMRNNDVKAKDRGVKVEAMEEHLGILPDGSFVPLTTRQKFFFGSALNKLEYKIKKVRKKSAEIVRTVASDETLEQDGKDIRLLREFILECLSPFKRHTLEVNNRTYDDLGAGSISWIFITGVLLFFLYWIFAWGIYQGDDVLNAWGAVFGTGAVSDILLIQVTKVVVLYYLPALAMQPQLLRIRSVLADISLNYINDHHPTNRRKPELDQTDEISVIQYMSAACRASRSSELCSLPAAWLLRQVSFMISSDFLLCTLSA